MNKNFESASSVICGCLFNVHFFMLYAPLSLVCACLVVVKMCNTNRQLQLKKTNRPSASKAAAPPGDKNLLTPA